MWLFTLEQIITNWSYTTLKWVTILTSTGLPCAGPGQNSEGGWVSFLLLPTWRSFFSSPFPLPSLLMCPGSLLFPPGAPRLGPSLVPWIFLAFFFQTWLPSVPFPLTFIMNSSQIPYHYNNTSVIQEYLLLSTSPLLCKGIKTITQKNSLKGETSLISLTLVFLKRNPSLRGSVYWISITNKIGCRIFIISQDTKLSRYS